MPRKFNRDKYLIKNYEHTEAEIDAMLKKQGGVCKICQRPPTGRSLHVDHWHSLTHYKIHTVKLAGGWLAKTADDMNKLKLYVEHTARTKSEAVKTVRRALLRLSVRGLLCWKCNSLLKWGGDNPDTLRAATLYLENYNSRFTG